MYATLHKPSMIEFKDILITTTMPLHRYLATYPRLSVALVEGDDIYAETPIVNGDLATGTWELNSSLCGNSVKQSVTLAIIASKEGFRIRVASVKLSMAELLMRIEARPDGDQEFKIMDSESSIQLIITCSVKVSLSLVLNNSPSHLGTQDTQATHAVDSRTKDTQSDYELFISELLPREELESVYSKVIRMSDHDEKARYLSKLGRTYLLMYQDEWGRIDLERAISLHEEAMQLSGPFHPQLAEHAHHFGMALMERFEQSGELVDIERTVSHCQTALKFTEDLDKDRPGRLSDLGSALQLRFQHLGDLADLQRAILLQQEAVELTPDGDPNKTERLNNLGIALRFRFQRLGSVADLEDVISNQRIAVELIPDDDPDKPLALNNLGNALGIRFNRLGSLVDLENAISSLQQAIKLMPDGRPSHPILLNNLGVALESRFERFGNLADLDDAISSLRQAVQLTADGHPAKSGRLSNLGGLLGSRFDRLGHLEDLEDAILNKQEAFELTPDGDPNKAEQFNTLGQALNTRFHRLGRLKDLEEAISTFRNAIQLTPDGHPSEPIRLTNLGNALESRFESLGGLEDLEDAISSLRRAVQLTPDGHPWQPTMLNNLGNALESRFDSLDGLEDLEDAISSLRQAVQLTLDDHPKKRSWLSNLGVALGSRFKRVGNLADLDDAISSLQKAVQLTPDGHPNKPGQLNNLGSVFIMRFKHLGIIADLDSALSTFSTAAKYTSGSAMIRFKAARDWAEVAEEYSRSPLEAFSCAIDLLPRIAWLGLAVADQHALLADVGGIVRDAVAAAIRYEEYETAVVWAEQGRSIVWQNFLGLRNPVDDLRETYPELANRLRSIAGQLEGSESHEPLGEVTARTEGVSQKYSKLALEWNNLVNEIRSLPNFKGFLKAKAFRQLAPAAHEGPVVILNITDVRCDALVLIADDSVERSVSAVSIPLERFSQEKSKNMLKILTELLSSAGVRERNDRKTGRAHSREDSDAKFKVILRVLWQDVVKPVIDGLAFQTKSKRPPRIWWCATGLLAFLPIHAAGMYDPQEVGETVADYVVSSYTPTLTAILELSDPVVREDFQVLTVAQASAPGAPPIPKTEDEVKIVRSLVASTRVLDLAKEKATVQGVREGMMESNWIHLACHGKQNSDNPMESGFLLHDRMLKLSEIVRMSLPKADFAFLSACQTAMGDEKVAEESVHLAAGMLLSGCRGVIATTWSIRDDDAPKIAQDVYSRMFKGGKPNRKEAAYALHEAVKLLRESGAPCTGWVPFIHIGR